MSWPDFLSREWESTSIFAYSTHTRPFLIPCLTPTWSFLSCLTRLTVTHTRLIWYSFTPYFQVSFQFVYSFQPTYLGSQWKQLRNKKFKRCKKSMHTYTYAKRRFTTYHKVIIIGLVCAGIFDEILQALWFSGAFVAKNLTMKLSFLSCQSNWRGL